MSDNDNVSHTLQKQLRQNFYDEKNADLEIHVEDKKFKVSKFILCLRSPIFFAMFNNDTEEKQTGIVKVKEYKPELVEKFLLFLYTDKIDLTDIEMEVYAIADYYDVLYLKKLCLDQLNKKFNRNVNVTTVYDYYDFAKNFSLSELEAKAIEFVKDNLSTIAKTEEWKKFDEKFRLEMFQSFFEQEPLLEIKYLQTGFYHDIHLNKEQIPCYEKLYFLKNNSDQKVAFKLSGIDHKNSASLFELSPTKGFVEPNQSLEIRLKSNGEVRVTVCYVRANRKNVDECFDGNDSVRQIIDYWHN